MDKIKISSLSFLDEQKFKKMASDREEWLNSGNDMLLNNNYLVNKMADLLKPDQILVSINRVFKENERFRTILLTSVNSATLPLFRAGQRISITLYINDKYYTKPYYLVSSPNDSINGEYKITVKNDSDSVVDDYLFNKAKIGERITISAPFGEFYYSSIRDKKNVIAIASGEGIMPIYSMMQAIVEGEEHFNLTLFYNEKKKDDLLYEEEINELVRKNANLKVKYVLIDEDRSGYLNGYISLDKIEPEFIVNDTSIFISGNEGLLKYLDKELETLKLPKKYIVYNSFFPVCNIKRVIKYKLSIYVNNEKYDIPCYNNKTIMQSLMDGGVYIPSKCQNGSCGFCRSELVSGDVKIINDKRNNADKKYNYIHPCSTYPLSDIEIIVR
ncbi:MAG: 2Fe-2S iron-sulfur cluster-binding protein [Candidatus Coprovivens sp.]